MSLENLNCSYYHELNFFQNYDRFYEAAWKLALPLLSQGKIFKKITQICWNDLKIWTIPIITRENFLQNEDSFVDVSLKFELPALSRVKIFAKIPQI